ncbi:unnamed protein product [Blepharisma stoltei]|uniref:Acyltransferase 3 domain-containing protein n=1 Tax=Blepharisma stoltei TaxID=1481888 RepID=A0AAU9JME4_9CILI|nr:unnamed protein product [Blepharisma stoltei]
MLPLIFALLFTLSQADPGICKSALISVYTKTHKDATKMLYYSGRDFDDLGKYDDCNDLDSAKYLLIRGKVQGNIGMIGLCGPKECSTSDYDDLKGWLDVALNLTSRGIELDTLKFYFSYDYNHEPLDGGAIFMVILWCLLIIVVISGTYLEYLKIQDPEKKFEGKLGLLMTFSAIHNSSKLFVLPIEKDNLQIFNGIRVFGMLYIIIGHSYVYQLSAAITNPNQAIDWITDFGHKFISMAQYLVDIFFLMAGFLLAYLTIGEMNRKNGRINWVVFISHRFIRMIPVYWFAFLNYLLLERYIGGGPQWPSFKQLTITGCDDYWWSNLLFLNNLLPSDAYCCMGWTWYVANDVQFYCFTPIILIIYYKRKYFAYILLCLLILLNFVIIAGLSDRHDYNPTILYGLNDKHQFLNIYVKPYTRMCTYILGLIIGFIYRSNVDYRPVSLISPVTDIENSEQSAFESQLYPDKEREVSDNSNLDWVTNLEVMSVRWIHNWYIRYSAYALGAGLMFMINFLPYQLDDHGLDYWTQNGKTTFLVFEHFTFAVGFSLILIPMLFGKGRVLNYILSFKYLVPLARISFSVYIIHPIFIYLVALSRYQAFYLQDWELLYNAIATIFLSFIVGFILSMTLESPILSLERKLLRKK